MAAKTAEKAEKQKAKKPAAKKAAKKTAKGKKDATPDSVKNKLGVTKKAKKKKTPAVIHIKEDFCKGCGICVALCPAQTLGLKGGKVTVLNIESCTKCMFCELRCPDFAISVEE